MVTSNIMRYAVKEETEEERNRREEEARKNDPWAEENAEEEEITKINTVNGFYNNLEQLGVTEKEISDNQKSIMSYLK